jgi:hypothetical protein
VWRWIYRGTVTIVAVALTVGGFAFILASTFVPELFPEGWREPLHHVLRDVGIATLVSGLVSIAYEYALRYSFTRETQSNLRELFRERFEQVDLIREAGIKTIHTRLPKNKVVDEIRYAKRIRILQTWTADFAETDDLGTALEDAATSGEVIDIRILLLDPSSHGALSRGRDLGRDGDDVVKCIKNDLRDLERLCSKDPRLNDKIQVRLYDATPVMAIHGYDNTNIVGFYWHGQVSQRGTQFELYSELGEQKTSQRRSANGKSQFSRAVDKHFTELWDNATRIEEAKEVSEWK